MTPEEIQAIPGITAKALESIQYSVNAYYGPYEDEVPAEAAPTPEPAAGAETEIAPAEAVPAATGEAPEPETASPETEVKE